MSYLTGAASGAGVAGSVAVAGTAGPSGTHAAAVGPPVAVSAHTRRARGARGVGEHAHVRAGQPCACRSHRVTQRKIRSERVTLGHTLLSSTLFFRSII